jgi:hypothetical protein
MHELTENIKRNKEVIPTGVRKLDHCPPVSEPICPIAIEK